MDEQPRGFSRWYKSLEYVSNHSVKGKTENLADQIIEERNKIWNSMLETLKKFW